VQIARPFPDFLARTSSGPEASTMADHEQRSSAVRHLIRKLVRSTGYELFNARTHYAEDGLFTLHRHSFSLDPRFRGAYARGVKASHGVDPHFEWRVHVALWAALSAMEVPGAFVECGVNAGFISSAIMRRLDWGTAAKRFYLIDTFNGPVVSQYSSEEIDHGRLKVAEDALAAGAYVTDMVRVQENFSEWPNVQVVQGVIPEILPTLAIDRVAFLHIDLNCAYPEQAALEFFWDRLSSGAFVLLDDYAYLGHDCQARAIDTVARSRRFEVLSLPTGQGLIIKRACVL
jgi:hypothetical protein